MNEHTRAPSPSTVLPLLESRFYHENAIYLLRLHGDGNVCSWSPVDNDLVVAAPEAVAVELSNILTARGIDNDHYYFGREHRIRQKSKICSPSIMDESQVKHCYSFEIHYAVKYKTKFAVQRAVFCSADAVSVSKWLGELTHRLESIHQDRPKTLLVVANPFGGRRKAIDIYKKQAEPLFALAGIQTNFMVTERPNHAYDYLLENGWHDTDGIVCVGGDGTLSEVVNAIIMRTARICGVNMNNIDVEIPPVNVRVGIIPAGSTDTVLYSLLGSSDVVNAVIHIIFGDSFACDICTVHSENAYNCSFISLMSYGYLGDVIKNSMSLRWLGPVRYDYAGARHFICHRSYEGTVSFLRDSQCDDDQSVCEKNGCHCILQNDKMNMGNDERWELIRGKFFMVTAANISCACSRSPNGIAPHCHFADGYLNLLLIRRVTFCEKVKLLLTLSNSDKHKLVNKLDFVEIYRTRRFKFETGYGSGVIPATNISSWNIDGELMRDTHLHVQCHRQVIHFFVKKRN